MKDFFDIPFYAAELPCPLPTNVEIENALDISLEYRGQRIVGIGQHFIVKFGHRINLTERENILFVRENINICIPQAFALYSDTETGKSFIVIKRIIS